MQGPSLSCLGRLRTLGTISTGGRGLAVRIVSSSQFIKVGDSSGGLNEGNLHLDVVVRGGL